MTFIKNNYNPCFVRGFVCAIGGNVDRYSDVFLPCVSGQESIDAMLEENLLLKNHILGLLKIIEDQERVLKINGLYPWKENRDKW